MTKEEKNKKTGKEETKLFIPWLKENAKALFWATLIALSIRSFAVEPFNIPSGSMIPSLLVGDYLFVTKGSYGYSRYSLPFGIPLLPNRLFYSEPKRGDVVVFKVPYDNSTDYIKRVIGLPGDKIQVKEGRLYINDQQVERTFKGRYLTPRDRTPVEHNLYEEVLPNGIRHDILEYSDNEKQDNTEAFIVPEDHFFMMGDNRDNSQDSRFEKVGFVPKENLVGKAQIIFYSNNGYSPFIFFWNWGESIRAERLFSRIK